MAIQTAFSSEPNPAIFEALSNSTEEGQALYNIAKTRMQMAASES